MAICVFAFRRDVPYPTYGEALARNDLCACVRSVPCPIIGEASVASCVYAFRRHVPWPTSGEALVLDDMLACVRDLPCRTDGEALEACCVFAFMRDVPYPTSGEARVVSNAFVCVRGVPCPINGEALEFGYRFACAVMCHARLAGRHSLLAGVVNSVGARRSRRQFRVPRRCARV